MTPLIELYHAAIRQYDRWVVVPGMASMVKQSTPESSNDHQREVFVDMLTNHICNKKAWNNQENLPYEVTSMAMWYFPPEE